MRVDYPFIHVTLPCILHPAPHPNLQLHHHILCPNCTDDQVHCRAWLFTATTAYTALVVHITAQWVESYYMSNTSEYAFPPISATL